MANPILQVENLSKSFGDLLLFENVSFGMTEGQHVGLIGKNGCGKSTLLGLLAGLDSADEGRITFRKDVKVGYLPQTPVFHEGETVWDACGRVMKDEEEELRVKRLLTQLRITDLNQPVAELSGGKQKCVALAHALLSEPDFLIMDEPTNHLDLEIIEWLEEYLRLNKVSLLMVTHDRYFLDRICTDILEIDAQGVYAYQGNYSYYLEKRQERLDAKQVEVARANNLYRTELEWMRRMPQARGHKARYREEAFYELEKVAKQRFDERNVKLEVKSAYIGKKIFEADHLYKSFGEKKILDDFSYIFSRYEKMGIVGNNGTGKSTFLKILLGQQQPDSGKLEIGETVRFGYYSQEGLHFNEQMKVIDVVRNIAEEIQMGNGRKLTAAQLLQMFLFPPSTQYNYVYKLSGGERRRLYLCTVLMQNPNFLILDEPTNDLDVTTLEVLEEYLIGFKGCILVVSHDRFFMDKVVDHILAFEGDGKIKDYPGNYTDYREWKALQEAKKAEESKNADKQVQDKQPARRAHSSDAKRKMTFKEKREFEALDADINALETEKAEIEKAFADGLSDPDKITELSKRLEVINAELDEKSMRWLELSELD